MAVRRLGRPSTGAFYALAVAGDRAGLVLGECAGEAPAAALAQALAARRFLEAHLLDGAVEDRIAEARRAFGADRLAWRTWSAAEPPSTAAVTLLNAADAARAGAYVRRAIGVAPSGMAEDLAALLEAQGLLAVVASAQRGQS